MDGSSSNYKSIFILKSEFDIKSISAYLYADTQYEDSESHDKLADLPVILNLPLKVIEQRSDHQQMNQGEIPFKVLRLSNNIDFSKVVDEFADNEVVDL